MFINFNAASEYSLGVELEIQTISRLTGELIPGAGIILAQLPGEVLFKPELFNSTIEINTPVCKTISELEKHLKQNIKIVQEIGHQHDIDILISGCHPYSNWQQQQVTRQERYLNLLHRVQWPVRQFLIFGLHVHVGIDDADKAIFVMNRFTAFLPYLIALSASSPFWNGFDTGLATTRIKIFEELPNAGIPYYFKNWKMYSALVENLIKTNSIDTVRDLWWDIRPHPIFGTLEVRVCDAMPTMKETMALIALIYTLVIKFSKEFEANGKLSRQDRWILAENKWRAARYGIHGEFIIGKKGKTRNIRDAVFELYQEAYNFCSSAEMKDTRIYLSTIPEILDKGPSYARQRQWARKRPGDYKYIINNLLKETRENSFYEE
ncbi:MAG: YbdK family carboxylate-amine ligase [Calditrichaeota bacterium]|nr:YbdK family carboxylate-amine ligase [Calditrichota bacterium]